MDVMMGWLIFFLGLAAFAFVAPAMVQRYLERLPVAPGCPSCRAVTRETWEGGIAGWLTRVTDNTAVRECARCGWRGRMRWKWAPLRLRDTGGG